MDKKEEVKLTVKPKYNVIFSFLYNHVTTLLIIILILAVLIFENQLIRIWYSNISYICYIPNNKCYL